MGQIVIVASTLDILSFLRGFPDASFSGCKISEGQCSTYTQPRLASVPAWGRYLRQPPVMYVVARMARPLVSFISTSDPTVQC
jgi:hypothetical protein